MKAADRIQDVRPVSREEMRELDRRAIEDLGIPGMVLMENAGRSVAETVLAILEKPATVGAGRQHVSIVCGKGNNGGDGYVIARHLLNHGVQVKVLLVRKEIDISSDSDAGRNFAVLRRLKTADLEIRTIETSPEWPGILGCSAVVIDAIFGTGLDKRVGPPYGDVIALMNNSGRPVVAVDVPSGLDSNSGMPLGECIRAETTVTFAAPKIGFFRGRAAEFVGRLEVVDIGIPRELLPKEG
jgi:NAD(P)H-hydrate epimerase